MSEARRMLAGFNGRHVEVECRTERLAAEVQRRLVHVVSPPDTAPSVILHVSFDEPEESWTEARDSTGRCERGSFEYVAYHARKWITTAFVDAHPDLTWLHASAASMDGRAIVLAGPAGAGKSTLLVRLVGSGWQLLADDAVAIRLDTGEALPLPISPEVRGAPHEPGQEWCAFLAQTKTLTDVSSDRVASTPAAVAAIVYLKFAAEGAGTEITRLSVVSAAQSLATQTLGARRPGGVNVGELVRLSRQIPCYRLRYSDASSVVDELARVGRKHAGNACE